MAHDRGLAASPWVGYTIIAGSDDRFPCPPPEPGVVDKSSALVRHVDSVKSYRLHATIQRRSRLSPSRWSASTSHTFFVRTPCQMNVSKAG